MFTFKLPTYEELKQNYETYLKDVQKFYKDFYSDIQKTFNKQTFKANFGKTISSWKA